jgi:hypothetical protein
VLATRGGSDIGDIVRAAHMTKSLFDEEVIEQQRIADDGVVAAIALGCLLERVKALKERYYEAHQREVIKAGAGRALAGRCNS